ncbi:MAG: 3D domain-containing protein [Faecousia sp.]
MYRRKMTPLKKQKLFIRLLLMVLILMLFIALMAPAALAKTYVIRDGQRVITYTTFATDPARILGEAGMDLGEQDTYTTESSEDGQTIHIQRMQRITITYHGQTTSATSYGETVGELLLRLNLDVSGEDVVSHGMEESTYDEMVLQIDRVVTASETFTTTLRHEVSYCTDASLPEGTQEVLTQGVDGELLCTADVTYVNGRETKRVIHSQTVTKAPVTEIIGLGSGGAAVVASPDPAPVIEDGYIHLPSGEVLTYSGSDTIRATAYTHTDEGCDFATATGTTVHRGTVAVDPRYIPYGTRMFIVSNDGAYVCGICVAEDCGGDIKGDRMDIYFPTYEQCREFGRRVCTIYYLT